jgi:sensor histidine kinase regulating citrate/malate metabolism
VARLKVEEVVPAAARTIKSLRDIGYELPQAVADLVDNSIEARANEVHIDLCFDGPDSWIRIADNGDGMDASTITESLRIGSVREYEENDLGKFGFGLKTASISQCRRVVVASRVSPQRARVEARLAAMRTCY